MREQDEKVRGVMEQHRPEEERREDHAVVESHDEEQDHEEVTEILRLPEVVAVRKKS